MNNKNKEKGFTLIELIISIGLMSGIIYSSYSSLTKIIRSKKLVEQNRKTLLIANAVISRMILEIQKISKEKHLLDPEKKVFLLGQSDSLSNGESSSSITFLASNVGQYLPNKKHNTPLVEISYRVATNPDLAPNQEIETFYLIREETPNLNDYNEALEYKMSFPITDNLISLNFSYYDEKNEEWLNEWEDQRDLPLQIRFTIKLLGENNKIKTYSTTVPINTSKK